MAIYHSSTKIIGRSSGRSSVGASAYRAGEKLHNERDGVTHDYTKKTGVEHTEIMTPDHVPEWAKDRQKLWNEVEKIEKAKNSQLAREVEVALPKELSRENQIELVREYTKENFTDKGMVADISIHDKGDGNPHAHIMLTMRPFKEDGTWGAKSKKEYVLDKQGEKIKLPSGEYKSNKVSSTDWDKKETLLKWRENWAKDCNKYLEREGHQQRIDHRSYKDQGLEKVPTKHEGHIVRAMESRGIQTEIGDINRQIQEQNKMAELIDKQIIYYERSLEYERTRVDGIKNRVTGTERGSTESISKLLLRRDRRTSEINSSRTSNISQPSEQSIRGKQDGQTDYKNEIGREREIKSRLDKTIERNNKGHEAGDNGLEGSQYTENRKDLQGNIGGQTQERGKIQGTDEGIKGHGLSVEINTESKLEGTSKTILNTSSDNTRDNVDTGRSIPTSEPFSGIFQQLSKAIEKANRLEKEKAEQKAQKQVFAKTKTRGKDRGRDR